MNFSPESNVSVDNILSDVMKKMGDEDHILFSPGYYVHLVQRALENLSLDSLLLEFHKDFDFPSDTLQVAMPKGAFNVRGIFLWSGDCCKVEDMTNVYYKSGYRTKGENYGHTSMNKQGVDHDYFISNYSSGDSIYFYNIQNGNIVFSSYCSSFEKVRVVYNGVATNIGDVPVIPLPFRDAVIYWTVNEALNTLYLRTGNPVYERMWRNMENKLNARFDGIWDKAVYRAKNLDSKVRKDYVEYLSKMNY